MCARLDLSPVPQRKKDKKTLLRSFKKRIGQGCVEDAMFDLRGEGYGGAGPEWAEKACTKGSVCQVRKEAGSQRLGGEMKPSIACGCCV